MSKLADTWVTMPNMDSNQLHRSILYNELELKSNHTLIGIILNNMTFCSEYYNTMLFHKNL